MTKKPMVGQIFLTIIEFFSFFLKKDCLFPKGNTKVLKLKERERDHTFLLQISFQNFPMQQVYNAQM